MANKVTFDYSKASSFIQEHEMEYMSELAAQAKDKLVAKTGAGNDFLGWIDLPVDYDKEEFARIKKAAEQIRSDSEVLLVIGIGGSYLGARAAIDFLGHSFANVVSRQNTDSYEFTLRETRTYEIIDDVKNYRSELGILYINEFNRKVLEKLFKENGLVFHPLLQADPHIFINVSHPLAGRKSVSIQELEPYPFLAFEQGEQNSFYFSEEILSTIPRKKVIYVSDRATLFNLLIGLNGYTICSGIPNSNLNGDSIIAVPLETEESMLIGWIANPRLHLSEFAKKYLEELERLIR